MICFDFGWCREPEWNKYCEIISIWFIGLFKYTENFGYKTRRTIEPERWRKEEVAFIHIDRRRCFLWKWKFGKCDVLMSLFRRVSSNILISYWYDIKWKAGRFIMNKLGRKCHHPSRINFYSATSKIDPPENSDNAIDISSLFVSWDLLTTIRFHILAASATVVQTVLQPASSISFCGLL